MTPSLSPRNGDCRWLDSKREVQPQAVEPRTAAIVLRSETPTGRSRSHVPTTNVYLRSPRILAHDRSSWSWQDWRSRETRGKISSFPPLLPVRILWHSRDGQSHCQLSVASILQPVAKLADTETIARANIEYAHILRSRVLPSDGGHAQTGEIRRFRSVLGSYGPTVRTWTVLRACLTNFADVCRMVVHLKRLTISRFFSTIGIKSEAC